MKVEQNSINIPQILDYDDYRVYLRACFDFQKSLHKSYNLEKMAFELGLSYSNLKMILNGKRNLTLDHILSVSNGLHHSLHEKMLFEALVHKSKAKNIEQKKYFESKLEESLSEIQTSQKISQNRDLLTKWFFPVLVLYILDVLQPHDIVFDRRLFALLSAKFPINGDDFKLLEKIFTDKEITSIGKDGKIILSFKKLNMTIDQELYLKQIVDMHYKNIRKSYNHTMAISLRADKLSEFRAEYKKLLEKYVAMDLDQDGDNLVAQVSWFLMPFERNK